MINIQKDLDIVSQIIKDNFSELLPDNLLYKFLFSPSKKIRSKFTILYLKSINAIFNEKIYTIIAAGEIIHNASLLHDDVIDNAQTRRGMSTIGNKCNEKISIISGDYLISIAIDLLLKVNDIKVLKIFNDCIKAMCIAEVEQFNLRNTVPTIEQYKNICNLKTAMLFKTILLSCLIINGYPLQEASEFAELYGINFQILNDLDEDGYFKDLNNGIYTAKEILGIEKTKILLDNNIQKMRELIYLLPNDSYKKELESLILKL